MVHLRNCSHRSNRSEPELPRPKTWGPKTNCYKQRVEFSSLMQICLYDEGPNTDPTFRTNLDGVSTRTSSLGATTGQLSSSVLPKDMRPLVIHSCLLLLDVQVSLFRPIVELNHPACV